MGKRWGISKATAGRVLKKLERLQYLSLMTFPGRTGSVVYLQGYLSTMFQISDVLIDKDEVAMTLNINISLQEEAPCEAPAATKHSISVSPELSCVSKAHMEQILQKLAEILAAQGISCLGCPKSIYKLYPLSDACGERYFIHTKSGEEHRFGLSVQCGAGKTVYTFELTLSPKPNNHFRRKPT